MPSHFHSTSQSAGVAERLDRRSSSGEARKNGYGRDRSSSVRSGDRSAANQSAVGVHSPISRAAIVVGRQLRRLRQRADDQRLRHADAQLAGEQLEQDEALQPVERRPPRRSRAPAAPPGSRPLSGRMRSSTHCERAAGRSRTGAAAADRGPAPPSRRRRRRPRSTRRAASRRRPVAASVQPLIARVGQQPLQPPAGEEEHRPRRIRRRRADEIARHRLDLGVGRRRAVDRVEERERSLGSSCRVRSLALALVLSQLAAPTHRMTPALEAALARR